MVVYHSTEELYANEDMELVDIIEKKDLYEKYKNVTFEEHKFYFRINKVTFIATGEKFVPKTFTEEGFLLYDTVDMNVKPTDNCYVRLFGILYRPGGSKELVTTTGCWSLGLNPNVSAGIPPKIGGERMWNLKLNREVRKKSVDKITNNLKTATKLTVMDYKFISRLLNPLTGDSFLNPLKAGKNSYRPNANPLPKKDIVEILASERVQKLILKELGVVMPELAKEIQKLTNPEAIATFLQKIADDTVNSKEATVEDKLLSVQAILNAGYPDEGVILNPPADRLPIGMAGMPNQPQQNLISYEQPKIMGGNEVEQPGEDKPKPDEMSDEEFKKAKEDAGALEGHTFSDIEPLNLGVDEEVRTAAN
jgi:hypothetical protein